MAQSPPSCPHCGRSHAASHAPSAPVAAVVAALRGIARRLADAVGPQRVARLGAAAPLIIPATLPAAARVPVAHAVGTQRLGARGGTAAHGTVVDEGAALEDGPRSVLRHEGRAERRHVVDEGAVGDERRGVARHEHCALAVGGAAAVADGKAREADGARLGVVERDEARRAAAVDDRDGRAVGRADGQQLAAQVEILYAAGAAQQRRAVGAGVKLDLVPVDDVGAVDEPLDVHRVRIAR
eukprot:scaffold104476_cov67-Phaeocystis_antarctica.AAC.5